MTQHLQGRTLPIMALRGGHTHGCARTALPIMALPIMGSGSGRP
jgi:hypothetical protein